MPRSRSTVTALVLCWVLALILVTGLGYIALGGSAGARERQGAEGLLVTQPAPPANLAGTPTPVLAPDDDTGNAPSADGLRAVLGPRVADPRLGEAAVSVVDAETGDSVFAQRDSVLVGPASTAKLVTATAVLASYGPYHRFSTRVVAGPAPGEIVLIGGGDPTLAVGPKVTYPGAARLDVLAAAVRKTLGDTKVTKVVVDSSLFTGPDTGPGWDADIVSGGFAAPVNALTVNGGRTTPNTEARSERTPTPDLFAGQAFARLLGAEGATVDRGTAPAGAALLGRLDSPPLIHIVEQMLQQSDNVIAESMARQVAVAKKQPATFTGAANAIRGVLTDLGLEPANDRLVDGSGLSRQNLVTTSLLTGVLALAAGPHQPGLRGVLSGLPVAASRQ